jgi:hypothetical protein
MLRAVAVADHAMVRFRGRDGVIDHEITSAQRAMFQDMLSAFKELGGS